MFTNICCFPMLSHIKDSIDHKQQNLQNLNTIAISNLHYVSILVVWERLTTGSMEKYSLEYISFLHTKKRFSSWGEYTMQFLGDKKWLSSFLKVVFPLKICHTKNIDSAVDFWNRGCSWDLNWFSNNAFLNRGSLNSKVPQNVSMDSPRTCEIS